MGLVAPRHVGSSQTRAQTRVPCIGRQILNHCATREAPRLFLNTHEGVPWQSSGGLCASTAGGTGSIPGQGTKIPQAARPERKQNKMKQNKNKDTHESLINQLIPVEDFTSLK